MKIFQALIYKMTKETFKTYHMKIMQELLHIIQIEMFVYMGLVN